MNGRILASPSRLTRVYLNLIGLTLSKVLIISQCTVGFGNFLYSISFTWNLDLIPLYQSTRTVLTPTRMSSNIQQIM